MVRISRFFALLPLVLASLFVLDLPGQVRAEDKEKGAATLTYGEAMRLGREAFSLKRYRAAYLYFGQALSADPSSKEARDKATEAMILARREGGGSLTETERRYPPIPKELEDEIEREVEKRFKTDVSPDKKPEIPGPEEESTREGVPEGEREYVRPEDQPRTPVEEKGERPEIVRPGLTTVLGVATRISLAPLITGRNNIFHALIHIQPFEGVRTLDEKVWYVEAGYDYAIGSLEDGRFGPGTTDLILRYDNNAFHQGYIKLAHGLLEGLELRASLDTANLREGNQDILLTDYATSPETIYVRSYDRRADIGNLVLGVKWNFFRTLSDWPKEDPETGLTGIFDVKVPLAQNPKNFTSSGRFDLAFSLVGSYYLGRLGWFPFILHAGAGVTLPLGQGYFSHDVDFDPVFSFAGGAALKIAGWAVLVGQIMGNTSAFTEFEPLSGLVLETHVGIRLMIGHFFLESSVGFPMSNAASTFSFTLKFGLHFMGKEREEEIIT